MYSVFSLKSNFYAKDFEKILVEEATKNLVIPALNKNPI